MSQPALLVSGCVLPVAVIALESFIRACLFRPRLAEAGARGNHKQTAILFLPLYSAVPTHTHTHTHT